MKKLIILLSALPLLASGDVFASEKPDFRITRMWMDNSCSRVYVSFTNKGGGLSADHYDRTKYPSKFFKVSSKQNPQVLLYLDQVDPNRRMTVKNGVATFEVTQYVHFENGARVSTMINYGHRIDESRYGAPNHGTVQLRCGKWPDIGEGPLKVEYFGIVPNSDCSIRVRIKNPGPKALTLNAWNDRWDINNSLAWDNQAQSQLRLRELDPEKKLRSPGGSVTHVFRSDRYIRPFEPGDVKDVRLHGYWVTSSAKSVFDVTKKLGCGADLHLHRSHSVQPKHPRAGDTVTLRFTIRNSGPDTAGKSRAAVKFGGETRPRLYDIPKLHANRAHTIRRTIENVRPGRYRVRFAIDHGNRVVEHDERNNRKQFVLTVK